MAKNKAQQVESAVGFSEGSSTLVDLANVAETRFEALPRGLYPCVIAECEFLYSQAKGNPMWTLTLEVSDGEYAGRRLYSHLVWAGEGLGITKRVVSRIAPELLNGPFDPQSDEVIASMLGREVKAKVTVKKYEGEDRNNVRDLFAGGSDSFL